MLPLDEVKCFTVYSSQGIWFNDDNEGGTENANLLRTMKENMKMK